MAVITGTFNSLVSGTITGVFQNTAGGVLSGVIGTPGPAGNTGATGATGATGSPGPGVAAGGSTGQVLQKLSATSYDTGWLTIPSEYISSVTAPLSVSSGNLSVSLSAYLSKAGNLSGLTSLSAARDNLNLGTANTPVFAGVTAQGSGANVAQLTPTSLTLTHATAGIFTIQPSQGIVFPDSTIQTSAGLPPATAASTYAVIAAGQPVAGNTGQVLTKQSGTNYDSIWTTIVPGDRYLTSSTTSNTVSNGNKTFTIGTGLSYTPTQNITISYNAANHMHAEVLTYNSGTGVLTVDVKNHTGAGTYAAWVVNVGGVTPATLVAWGAITGTLSTQTDLQNALDLKLDVTTAASTYYLQTNPDGFIGDAPSDGSTYGRNNGAWAVAGGGSYLPLAGGALDANASVTASDTSTLTDSELAGWGLGVQLTADHTKGTTVEFDGLDAYDGLSHMQVTPTGLTFPDATVQTVGFPGFTGYASESWVTAGFYPLTGNPSAFIDASALTPYLTSSTALAYFSPIGSPSFTGNPIAPTPATGDNSTSIATTAFVKTQGYATLASPSLTGTPRSTTAAADTNSTVIATTAFVVGQAGSATPIVDGTAAVGTSLRYARADHVHPTDTSRAALNSPTFTGTPTLPTGTIATTQTPGNNTTAVATTAFVLANAGSTSFATTAQVVAATSTTTAIAPANQGFLMTNPRLQTFAFINSAAASGSGASTTSNPQNFSRQIYLNSLAVGRSAYIFGVIGVANAGFGTSTAKADQVDFSKKVWISGYACMGWTGGTSYIGDANTMCRITLGGYSTNTTGDMTLNGIGLKKVGGAASTVSLTVHNGTTLTDVASSVTVPDGGGIHWQIYSDGTGNVTLYINGTQAATTTAGPTTATASGSACYREQVEAAVTPGVRQVMNCNGGWFYTE